MTDKNQKKTLRSCLCSNCQGLIFGLLNELRNNARKHKRGTMILDCIDDLQVSLEEGDISSVVSRDDSYSKGFRVGRRIKR